MATITTIQATDAITDSRAVINTNFSNLNSDKAETSAIPVKATGAEIDTGTDDAKFATAKAIADSGLVFTSDLSSYVPKSLYDAQTILGATADNTPVAITLSEQSVVGRVTGGNVSIIGIGINDDNILQADDGSITDNDYAKFTVNGVEGVPYATVLSDIGALPLAGGTMTGNIQLGETEIKLDATLSQDEKWSGITTAGTLGATIAVGDLCYLNNDDGRWELADANLSDGYDKQLGICLVAGNDGDATTLLVFGKVRSAAFPAFTVGSPLYMSETAGDITHTQPTTADVAIRLVGFALTAEDLLFNPSNDYIVHT